MKRISKGAAWLIVFWLLVEVLILLVAGKQLWFKFAAKPGPEQFQCGALAVNLQTECDTLCVLKTMQVKHSSPGHIYVRNFEYADYIKAQQLKIDLVCVEGQYEPLLLRYIELKGQCQKHCFMIDYFSADGNFLGGEARQTADRRIQSQGKFPPAKLQQHGFALNQQGQFMVRQSKSLTTQVETLF